MWTRPWRLLVGLSFVLAGCGKCCDVSEPPAPPTSPTAATSDDLACCEVEPSRASLLTGTSVTNSQTVSTDNPASDTLKSGPEVGKDVRGPFQPLNVPGEQAGKKNCLYCANGPNPVAVVFARSVNPQVASLLRKLDEATQNNNKANMGSFAVFCSDKEGLEG